MIVDSLHEEVKSEYLITERKVKYKCILPLLRRFLSALPPPPPYSVQSPFHPFWDWYHDDDDCHHPNLPLPPSTLSEDKEGSDRVSGREEVCLSRNSYKYGVVYGMQSVEFKKNTWEYRMGRVSLNTINWNTKQCNLTYGNILRIIHDLYLATNTHLLRIPLYSAPPPLPLKGFHRKWICIW